MMTVTSRSEEEVFCDVPVAAEPAPVFDDVMIDIETMSLHPHNALILSIGMIEFDPSGTYRSVGDGAIADLKIGGKMLILPSLEEQLALGREVAASTQKFWRDQSDDARRHWMTPERCALSMALYSVRTFCAGKKRVWANGILFDLGNLVGLNAQVSGEPLWHYQAPRDMRDRVHDMPSTRIIPTGPTLDIPGVAHEPVYDCIVQAWQVWAHYQEK